MSGNVLIIPPEGLMEVFHTDGQVDTKRALELRGKGVHVRIPFVINGEPRGTVEFLSCDTEPVNPRGREAMALLTEVHMIFTGPVLFEGIGTDKIMELVSMLSTREGG